MPFMRRYADASRFGAEQAAEGAVRFNLQVEGCAPTPCPPGASPT